MKENFKRFDMNKKPLKTKWYLKPIEKLLCKPAFKKYRPIVHYVNGSENIKGPFLLLCNHNAFLDFKIANTLLKKNDANYVVAIDGFLKREWLLRNVGCICKRKFTNDTTLVKHLKRAVNMGNVVVLYPEARYSLCGTTALLPKSLGKLVKFLNVPVVTLICNGHHVNSPFWDTSHERGVDHTEATYKVLINKEDIEKLSVDEINSMILEDFYYDDFMWQKNNNIKIDDKNRADGLDKVLYKCPHCNEEFKMSSKGTILKCNSCLKEWEMTPYGELKAINGETEFSHIPSWYEWERECVRKEIENETYTSNVLDVQVDSLPNAKGYIDIGNGTMVHDMNGFKVTVKDKDGDIHEMVKDPLSMYSCHIEYRYLFKKGDCVDLNTLKDTWYVYPKGNDFAVTKIALATEELYFYHQRKKGVEIKKGLA